LRFRRSAIWLLQDTHVSITFHTFFLLLKCNIHSKILSVKKIEKKEIWLNFIYFEIHLSYIYIRKDISLWCYFQFNFINLWQQISIIIAWNTRSRNCAEHANRKFLYKYLRYINDTRQTKVHHTVYFMCIWLWAD
jgi:hypothetical protein